MFSDASILTLKKGWDQFSRSGIKLLLEMANLFSLVNTINEANKQAITQLLGVGFHLDLI